MPTAKQPDHTLRQLHHGADGNAHVPHALFVHHRTKPGMRSAMQAIWEKHVKPRAAANPNHLAYYFCHDDSDPDVVCVFQLYQSKEAMADFLDGDWYPIYLAEVAGVIADPPQLTPSSLVWNKNDLI